LIFLPALWVALEVVRDRLLTGFGWMTLGYSQHRFLTVIQIADVTGVFGVSFLIVAVNVFLSEVCRIPRLAPVVRRRLMAAGGVVAVVMASVLGYGMIRMKQFAGPPGPGINVALIQPNVSQQRKWMASQRPLIVAEMLELTRQAARHNPDMIIWPETSYPAQIGRDPGEEERITDAVRQAGIPLLFGAITHHEGRYHNSAILLGADGREQQRYDKIHLVPFGEFLPLRRALPWLAMLVPIADFSPGKEATVFPVPDDGARKFGVVICFEDTVSRVVRRFVRAGAGLLVNMTNDAWFLDSAEPWMHLQAAVLRAVENRRTLIRAANTGVSCVIAPDGRVTAMLENAAGKKTFVAGWTTARAAWQDTTTFYTRRGDLFGFLCFFLYAAGILLIRKLS